MFTRRMDAAETASWAFYAMARLSRHVRKILWDDGEFVLSRCTLADQAAPVLVLAPVSERPAPGIIARMEHAYALR